MCVLACIYLDCVEAVKCFTEEIILWVLWTYYFLKYEIRAVGFSDGYIDIISKSCTVIRL